MLTRISLSYLGCALASSSLSFIVCISFLTLMTSKVENPARTATLSTCLISSIQSINTIIIISYNKMLFRPSQNEDPMRSQSQRLRVNTKESFVQHRIDIKTLMLQNKQIVQKQKQLKLKVIKARKLKIKATDLLNFFCNQRSYQKQKTQSQYSQKQKMKKAVSLTKKHSFKFAKSVSLNKEVNKTLNKDQQIQNGSMNLFESFSYEQLLQMQEDQNYYLSNPQIIALFRKHMKNRRNNQKGFTQFNFMMNATQKPQFKENDLLSLRQSRIDMKNYIARSLGIDKISGNIKNKSILTTPIQNNSLIKNKSASYGALRHDFDQLKRLQVQNSNKKYKQFRNKLYDLKLNIYYKQGVVAERRAQLKDKRNLSVSKNNLQDSQRSLFYRKTSKNINSNYGQSVELAESIRAQLTRRKGLKKVAKQ